MGERTDQSRDGARHPTARRSASEQEPRRGSPLRKAVRLLRIIIPLLGVTLFLAGCQSQGPSGNAERRDGFYSGVSGGRTRP